MFGREKMKRQGGKGGSQIDYDRIAIWKEKFKKILAVVEKSFEFSMVTVLKECKHLEVLAAPEALRFYMIFICTSELISILGFKVNSI